QGANRFSRGSNRAVPRGENPQTAISSTLAAASRKPSCVNLPPMRRTPKSPSTTMMLDGSAKKPRTLEMITPSGPAFSTPAGMPRLWVRERYPTRALVSSLRLFGLRGVARFGGLVRRIEPGELGACFDFPENPGLKLFLVGPFGSHRLGE